MSPTMMNTTGAFPMDNWGFGLIALWGLHILSVVAFFTGVLFFIVLAIKMFTAAQLKQWAIGLIVAGIIVCLLTIVASPFRRPWVTFGFFGGNSMMNGGSMQMMEQMMEMMEEHDAGRNDPEHEEMRQLFRDFRGGGR